MRTPLNMVDRAVAFLEEAAERLAEGNWEPDGMRDLLIVAAREADAARHAISANAAAPAPKAKRVRKPRAKKQPSLPGVADASRTEES